MLVYAVAVLVCVPWLGYTYALTGRPLYWGNAGGLSLYWMSSPASGQLGDWHSVHAVLRDPRLAGQRPFFEHLATLDRLARDLTLQRVALRQIASHPANFASHVADNAGRMLFDAPYSVGRPPAEILSVALANLLLGLALARALVLWWRKRRKGERPSEEAIAFGLLAAGAFAVHLPLSADPRMLMPIVPIAVWALARVPWRVPALAPRRAKASEAMSG